MINWKAGTGVNCFSVTCYSINTFGVCLNFDLLFAYWIINRFQHWFPTLNLLTRMTTVNHPVGVFLVQLETALTLLSVLITHCDKWSPYVIDVDIEGVILYWVLYNNSSSGQDCRNKYKGDHLSSFSIGCQEKWQSPMTVDKKRCTSSTPWIFLNRPRLANLIPTLKLLLCSTWRSLNAL